jgi:hypothetical protein
MVGIQNEFSAIKIRLEMYDDTYNNKTPSYEEQLLLALLFRDA